MGKRSTFTQAELERAGRAARKLDPASIIEVTKSGTIRILPPAQAADDRSAKQKRIDDWFENDEN